METSVAVSPAASRAFARLIDYAGLFPPAQLALPQAQTEYEEARAGPHCWMLGPFIIPVPLLAEVARGFLGPFSAIAAPSEIETVAALRDRGVAIDAVETPFPGSGDGEGALREALQAHRAALDGLGLSGVPVYLEFRQLRENGITIESAISAAAATRFGAKLRCGGITAGAFPAVDDVARFIATAAAANVPFKATAGLHHPVRHLNAASGFVMHGFLNILAAAALTPQVDLATLNDIVAEEDPAAFSFDAGAMRWRDHRIDLTRLAETRDRVFVSYGSCSFAEPVDDLSALGLLGAR